MENMLNDLNEYLADLNVFYRKLQNYHWNVEGKDFFIVHSKLEEYYNEINKQIDEVAEYILTIGGQPLGTMKDYINISKITEAQNVKVKSDLIYNELVKDYSHLLECTKKIKQEAETISNAQTSTFMDDLIEGYSKTLWMLKQTVSN